MISPSRFWSQWRLAHWLFGYVYDVGENAPTYKKQEKVPHLSARSVHLWILIHTFVPLALHQFYIYLLGHNLGFTRTFIHYSLSMVFSMMCLLRGVYKIGHTYGFLDGHRHRRYDIRGSRVDKTVLSIFFAAMLRPALAVYFVYDIATAPLSMNWIWLPINISLYPIILDFWYYWYHRLMHELDGLWKYHHTHHLIKYPTAICVIHSDAEQVFFDVFAIPFLTFTTMNLTGLPIGFYEVYICLVLAVTAELAGHSGLRVHAVAANPLSWLLEKFDAELTIEDHDLHHRYGARKSYNYGKQTRIWDRVFNTCGDRIETVKSNVDYDRTVWWPIL